MAEIAISPLISGMSPEGSKQTSADAARERTPRVAGAQFASHLGQRLSTQPSSSMGVPPANTSGSASTVRAMRTPLTGEQASEALARAWEAVTGEAPSDATKAILTAQWAHETGRGSAMMNFNFGGIKGASPGGLTAEYKTREGWGKNEIKIVDRFRAYQTAEEGAHDYVAFLTRRYPEAAEAAKAGEPEEFVRSLKARRYFTGNEHSYMKSVSSLTELALAQGPEALGQTHPGATELPLTPVDRQSFFHSRPPASYSAYGPIDTPSFGSVEAIADEVGRALLRATVRKDSDEF